jgi:hypothetical protein
VKGASFLNVREQIEQNEEKTLSPYAALSKPH